MAISIGGGKARVRPEMNITPLVDVVLVLLIIFMVVTPLLTKQFWVNVPRKDDSAAAAPQQPDDGPVVVHVDAQGTVKLNGEVIARASLAEKLRRVFAARSDHALFFTATDDAPYGVAVETLDIARAGGATPIAVVTEKLTPLRT